MPYRWTETQNARTLSLWPHQSMTPQGFTWFIGVTAAMLTLPLLAVLGTPVAWVLMVFFLAAIAAVWRAIMANRKSRQIREDLYLTPDHIRLEHRPAKGALKTWDANPMWVTLHLHPKGPVDDYLTLRGGGREVELGAFLTPEERESLYNELKPILRP